MPTFNNGEGLDSVRTKINAAIDKVDGTTPITSVDINSGTIDGVTIGSADAGAITGTTITGSTLVSTGDITVSGTVDGRDIASDGTKLDGIEAGADVTDTTNVTAAGALMDSELTNITAVKALDQGVATTDSPTFAGGTFTGNLSFGDNDKAIFGAGSDLQIYHDGSNSYISDQGTGNLLILSDANSGFLNAAATEWKVEATTDGAVKLYYDGNEKLATTSTGIAVTGNATFADNGKAIFGAGSDLQIYHDGLQSYVLDNGTGNLNLRGTSLRLSDAIGTHYLVANSGAEVSLTYSGAIKLATTSTGIDVTGTVTADNRYIVQDTSNAGTSDISYGSYANGAWINGLSGSNSYLATGGSGILKWNSTGVDVTGTITSDGLTVDGSGSISTGSSGGSAASNADDFVVEAGGDGGISILTPSTNTGTLFFGDNTASNAGQIKYSHSGGSFSFVTEQNTRMVIDSSGNVGIGTSSPAATLDVVGSAQIGASAAKTKFYSDSTYSGIFNGASLGSNESFYMGAGALFFYGGGSERMRIDASGNVGIGTSSPSHRLSVEGTANNSNSEIKVTAAGIASGYLGSNSNGFNIGTDTAGIVFKTGVTGGGSVGGSGSERMRIDASGNLLVGKTSAAYNTDGFEARPNGETYVSRSGTPMAINRNSSDGTLLNFYKNGATVGSIGTRNGDLTVGTGGVGLQFEDSTNTIDPVSLTTNVKTDGVVNLGEGSARFKDLYLSGTVNAATLNVDGGTIKLDGNYPVGTGNVALGNAALDSADAASANNVAIGNTAGTALTTGSDNTALGGGALAAASTATYNTAIGMNSLGSATGSANTGVGRRSLRNTTSGQYNVGIGADALFSNTTASNNTAVGYQAGYANTTGTAIDAFGRDALRSNTTGSNLVGIGYRALYSNTTGAYNTGVGQAALYSNTTADRNTAVGYVALNNNVTGAENTGIGYNALTSNTASYGTAVGSQALDANTTGTRNTAVGWGSLSGNSTGANNTAVGALAMLDSTTGSYNVAVGDEALTNNTTASNNTAVGYQAAYSNTTGLLTAIGRYASRQQTTGTNNTSVGLSAAYNTTTGGNNTAIGHEALNQNTTASNNTAVGYQAGYSGTTSAGNTLIGKQAGYALTTANGNTFIGSDSGDTVTTGQNNTILGRYNGNQGGLDIRTSSNNIVLSDGDGNPRLYYSQGSLTWFSPVIRDKTTASAANMHIDATSGAMLRSTSSLRYKNSISDATHGLTELMTLRPVTYKGNNDGDTVFGGLIAEEVHDAGLTEFVTYDDEGRPDALAYGQMVSLCIKAIQEQQATIEALEARITALETK